MDDEGDLVIECSLVGSDWRCRVTLPTSTGSHEYVVDVSRSELARFAPGHFDPTVLVAQSFRFLLEREGPESILSSFAVSDIERYFPEYGLHIAALMKQ